MRQPVYHIVAALSLAAGMVPAPLAAQSVQFGDDSSQFARDGECDDSRFTGAGMTDTTLIESDIGHDATDCRAAYNQGRIRLRGGGSSTRYASSGADHIMWGNNSSKYANDGECDDARFAGPGMTDTTLLESDIQHDASDCRSAYQQGRIHLRN